ncbi:group-specific protein [Bacillus cereus]|nr:group-specific protein [Bacillus cereus]
MKKKYLLASSPILLGVLCIIMFNIIGSEVKPDGTLVEQFFLIPLAYLFVFTGIIAILFVAVFSMFRKKQAR